jgi:hypothetical protein
MDYILYYSNYSESCRYLLHFFGRNKNDDIHFICIDNKISDGGKNYAILDNGVRILIPEFITCVPTVLSLHNGIQVLTGQQISQWMELRKNNHHQQSTKSNSYHHTEPSAFSFAGAADIVSDQYSFVEDNIVPNESKSENGMKQLHNYMPFHAAYQTQSTIYTPEEEKSDKKQKMPEGLTAAKIREQRDNELYNR